MDDSGKSWKKRLAFVPVAAVGVVALVALRASRAEPEKVDRAEAGRRVRTLVVEPRRVVPRATGYGVVEAREEWQMVAEVSGRVVEIGPQLEEGSFVEGDPLMPRSPYSAAKAGSDLIAMAYHETYELPVVITRSSNQFGPYQFPEKIIPFFVTTLLEGGKVPLYGDGLNVRDWLFVLDNCRGVETVLRKGTVGEVYNIGAGNEKTNREITDIILAALGKDESSVNYVEDRKGHDRRYSIATDKVAELGWAPQVTFEEAIELTVQWYVDNRAWWAPLRERVRNR